MIDNKEIDAYENKLLQLMIPLQERLKSTRYMREKKDYPGLYAHYHKLRCLQPILSDISQNRCLSEVDDFCSWDSATKIAGDIIYESIQNGQWDWILDLGYCKFKDQYEWNIQLSHSKGPTEDEWNKKVTKYLKDKGFNVTQVSIRYSYYYDEMFISCKINQEI